MRWRGGRRSSNIEDRRGARSSGRRGGGLRLGGKSSLLIVGIGIVAVLMGVDPKTVLSLVMGNVDLGGMLGGGAVSQPTNSGSSAGQSKEMNELADFTSVVLADTEDTWKPLFAQQGQTYKEPKLVLFTGAVKSACGHASSAMGPFYCPGDQKVYIDLSFYKDLKQRHNAPGDFAQAYVVAHEVGHHVQTITGISRKVHQMKQSVSKAEANKLQVRMELQADCYSGIWAHHANRARNIIEEGDIEEALNAAAQIGDDTLQRQAQGYVVPESFTHGSAEQRARWFKIGYKTGNIESCNTFKTQQL